MNYTMKLLMPLLIFVLVPFFGTTSAKLTWRMKPEEIIALRGNLVMLNCFVDGRNISNPGEHKFWWYRVDRNIVLSKNLQITATDPDSDRYSVLLDKYRGVYSLVIRNVSEADGGLYQCLLKQSRTGPQEASDNASLTVLTPPTHGYSPCTMFPESNIILSPKGDRALKCPKSTESFWRSVSSNIATNETVYHSWTSNKQVLHAFFLQNKTTLLSESSSLENEETVYCAVNSSMLQEYPNRCLLIPRGTSTKAVITPPITDVTNGAIVNFTCSHVDVAVAIDYTWDIPSELQVGGIQFVDNGRTIILKGIRGNWGEMLNIVCQVTTEWGVKANATATIAFLHKLITTPAVVNAIEKQEKPQVIKPRPIIPNESQKPSKSGTGNPALKNISILIGPALGVIILFLLAVIFALCVTKRKTSSAKHKLRLSHQLSSSTDPTKTVTLRTVNKPSNRNSRSSRRFSDSFTYRFSRDCEYENIEAYMAKKGQFLGGTTSFQDENNQPMEANVRVKIEMPNSLSTSMPALNHCKISSNVNGYIPNDESYQQHYSNHHPQQVHHQQYKPLANGNAYATREQIGFPPLTSQDYRDTEHYHVPTATSTMPHAVIDRSKKAMKPPNPPPRKPSY